MPESRSKRARLGVALLRALSVLLWAWSTGAILWAGVGPEPSRVAAALVFAVGFPLAWLSKRRRPRVRIAFFATVAIVLVAWQFKAPSNDRDWTPDVALLPYAEFEGDLVHVRNVRFCRYRSTTDFDVAHEDRTYDLRDLVSVDFLVEPFGAMRATAHTMLTFGFEGGEYLAISVEIRRERGESFHPIPGMFKEFEILYVVADERDVIRLRTDYRRDEVYLYPIRAERRKMREVFTDMLRRANALRERPEFYDTWRSSCTTNLARHVNAIAPRRVPLSWKLLFPGYADELAYDLGLIDTDLPFEEARRRFRIDERAREIGDVPEFSVEVRGGRP
jgi:hypothetical protein